MSVQKFDGAHTYYVVQWTDEDTGEWVDITDYIKIENDKKFFCYNNSLEKARKMMEGFRCRPTEQYYRIVEITITQTSKVHES
jgi:hypothetical protein